MKNKLQFKDLKNKLAAIAIMVTTCLLYSGGVYAQTSAVFDMRVYHSGEYTYKVATTSTSCNYPGVNSPTGNYHNANLGVVTETWYIKGRIALNWKEAAYTNGNLYYWVDDAAETTKQFNKSYEYSNWCENNWMRFETNEFQITKTSYSVGEHWLKLRARAPWYNDGLWYNNGCNDCYYAAKFTIPGFSQTAVSQTDYSCKVNETQSKTISFTKHYGTALVTSNCVLSGEDDESFEVTAISETGVTIKFKPTTSGTKNATCTITDAHSKTCVITLQGTATCTAPTVSDVSGDASMYLGDTKTYSVEASTTTGTISSYSWTLDPSGSTRLIGESSTNSISLKAETTTATGSHTATVTVSNSCGQSTQKAKTITVNAVPAPTSCSISVTAGSYGGTGTEADPYLVPLGTQFTITLTGVKAVESMTGFGWSLNSTSSKEANTTTTTWSKDITSSAVEGNVSTYTGYAWHYNQSTYFYSSSYASSDMIYIKAQTACSKPTTPTVSGAQAIYLGDNKTYTASSTTTTGTISSYTWTVPTGMSGTSTTSEISVTATATGSKVLSATATNDCGQTSESGGLSVAVSALTNPTPVSANRWINAGKEKTRVIWTPMSGYSQVMIVRYSKGKAVTAPTNGTQYSKNDVIGNGTVVYKGTGDKYQETSNQFVNFENGLEYTYYLYTNNNNYYSSGSNITTDMNTPANYYVFGNGSGHSDGWCGNKGWDEPTSSQMTGRGTSSSPAVKVFDNINQSTDLQFVVGDGCTRTDALSYDLYDGTNSQLYTGDAVVQGDQNGSTGRYAIKIQTTGKRKITISWNGKKITVKTEFACTTPTAGFDITGQLNAGEGSPWEGTQATGSTSETKGKNGYFAGGTYGSGVQNHRTITLTTAQQADNYTWACTSSNSANVSWKDDDNTSKTVYAVLNLPGTYTFNVQAKCSSDANYVTSETITIDVPYPEIGISGPFYNGAWNHAGAGTGAAQFTQDSENPLKWTNTFTTNTWDGQFVIIQRYKLGCTANDGWDGYNECSTTISSDGGNKVNRAGTLDMHGIKFATDDKNFGQNSVLSSNAKVRLTVLMEGYDTYDVTLEKVYTITGAVNNGDYGSITPTSAADKVAGEKVTFTATPNSGYEILKWNDGGNDVASTSTTYETTVGSDNKTITVYFKRSCVAPTEGFAATGQLNAGKGAPWAGTAAETTSDGYFADGYRTITLTTSQVADVYSWENISKPDNTTIEWTDQTSQTAKAMVNLPGTYTFKVSANCTSGSAVQSTLVTVNVPYPEIGMNGPLVDVNWGSNHCNTKDATHIMTRTGLTWSQTYTVSSSVSGEFVIIQRYKYGCAKDYSGATGTECSGWCGYQECGSNTKGGNNKINYATNNMTGLRYSGGNVGDNFVADITGLAEGDQITLTVTMTNVDAYTIVMSKECVAPSITAHPSTTARTYCKGEASPAQLTVTASGNNLSYQWKQCSTEGGTYSDVTAGTGGTTDTYTPSTATAGTLYYKCYVSNTCGNVLSEASGAYTINALPTNGTLSASPSSVCSGGTTTVSTTSTGMAGYQWYRYNGTKYVTISGATSQTYTSGSLTAEERYRVKITDNNGCSNTTTTAKACVVSVKAAALSITASTATVNPYTPVTLTAKNNSSVATNSSWTISGSGSYLENSNGVPYTTSPVTGTSSVVLKPAKGVETSVTATATVDGCEVSDTYTKTPTNDSQTCK